MNPPDDRLLSVTFWTAVCIVPVLLAAFVILWGFPEATDRLWAWTIQPSMTSLVMGGGYLSGAYFFCRVATDKSWHRVSAGFLATSVFTALLLGATLLHWDKFNHRHVSFWAWLGLYVVTPVLLPWLWACNRRTDTARPDEPDAMVPRVIRRLVASVGALQLAVALAMFVRPQLVLDRWPWTVTPLTARTLAAFIAFPAVTWVCFAFDQRWSSFRIPIQTATIGLGLTAVSAVRASADFDRSTATTWGFAVLLGAAILALITLQVAMRRVGASAGV